MRTADIIHSGPLGCWGGHCASTRILIAFHRGGYAGSSAPLPVDMKGRFFVRYTLANSFVRLTVLRGGETSMEWPPVTGRHSLF